MWQKGFNLCKFIFIVSSEDEFHFNNGIAIYNLRNLEFIVPYLAFL